MAKRWLSWNPIFLDTETTALDGQVCDLAIVDASGAVLLNTLVKPTVPISPAAQVIHHITNEMVADAPALADLLPDLNRICADRHIVAYNAEFDRAIMRNSAEHNGLVVDHHLAWEVWPWHCAMLLYAQYDGTLGRRGYKWWKQCEAAAHLGLSVPDDLHRALADADLTRRLLTAIAASG